jgi:O-antigen ligase
LVLPIFKLDFFGYWAARVPQVWMWLSGVILLFALSQKNLWRRIFLIYCLCLSIYLDFIVGYKVFFRVKGQVVERLMKDFRPGTLYTLGILCGSFFLIDLVQKLNKDWLKVCILYSSYLVFYFWIIKDFENEWIAGAYLAFTIPLILSSTRYLWLSLIASLIPICGVLLTKSTTAIVTSYIGIIGYLTLKKHWDLLRYFIILTIIGVYFFLPENFTAAPFRKTLWKLSLKCKSVEGFNTPKDKRTLKDHLIGTGLRSYRKYGFREGARTLATHPHNFLIEVYCELGLIGLLILLFYLGTLPWKHAPPEYVIGTISVIVYCLGYYAERLAPTGLLIIIYLGIMESYREEKGYEKVRTCFRNYWHRFTKFCCSKWRTIISFKLSRANQYS